MRDGSFEREIRESVGLRSVLPSQAALVCLRLGFGHLGWNASVRLFY